MAEPAVGLILAALDVPVSNGPAWNRWYDLEHLPPNIALTGISTGHRYVAGPSLHRSRLVTADEPIWAGGRSVYLTWYATSVDPGDAIATMTVRRDELEAEGRMDGAGERVVRTGDALDLVAGDGATELRLDPADLVHVGHRGLRLVIDADPDRTPTLAAGVVAALRFRSRFEPGRHVELQLLEQPARLSFDQLRATDPRADARLDAGFDRIVPLDHSFLADIMDSDLPRTLEEPS